MKRKIGELRNVPIVEGDKNLVRGGVEIHINDLQSDSSSGSSSKYAPRYFSIDFEKANEDWGKIMTTDIDLAAFKIAASYKYYGGEPIICAWGYPETNTLVPYSFSYIPLYISSEVINLIGVNNIQKGFKSLEEIIQIINVVVPKILSFPINLSMEGITEITEEEYYKID